MCDTPVQVQRLPDKLLHFLERQHEHDSIHLETFTKDITPETMLKRIFAKSKLQMKAHLWYMHERTIFDMPPLHACSLPSKVSFQYVVHKSMNSTAPQHNTYIPSALPRSLRNMYTYIPSALTRTLSSPKSLSAQSDNSRCQKACATKMLSSPVHWEEEFATKTDTRLVCSFACRCNYLFMQCAHIQRFYNDHTFMPCA